MNKNLQYELYVIYVNAFGQVTDATLWGSFFSVKDAELVDNSHVSTMEIEGAMTLLIDTKVRSIESFIDKHRNGVEQIRLMHKREAGCRTLNEYSRDDEGRYTYRITV